MVGDYMISVIIPDYNGEKYLDSCIESVVNQSFADIQIILVDDGSVDGSWNIIDEWRKKDHRILAIHQENSGVSIARNRGLELSNGEYITFIDCDDTIDPLMYEHMYGLSDNGTVDIIHCAYTKIDKNNVIHKIGGSMRQVLQTGEEANRCLLSGFMFTGSVCTKLFKNSIVSNLRFDGSLKANEDVLFDYLAFKKSKRVIFTDACLYNYYERVSSSCKTMGSIKSSEDCAKVEQIIWNSEKNTQLRVPALNKCFMAYSILYRTYLFAEDVRRKNCERIISTLPVSELTVSTKYRINYIIMLRIPHIYKQFYSIYNKIRKPNWDL